MYRWPSSDTSELRRVVVVLYGQQSKAAAYAAANVILGMGGDIHYPVPLELPVCLNYG